MEPHRFSRLAGAWRIGDDFFARAGVTSGNPPPRGLVDHRFDGALGHARVVFEFHRADRCVAAAVANGTDEADHGTDAAIADAQRGNLGREVEVGRLYADARLAHLSLPPA